MCLHEIYHKYVVLLLNILNNSDINNINIDIINNISKIYELIYNSNLIDYVNKNLEIISLKNQLKNYIKSNITFYLSDIFYSIGNNLVKIPDITIVFKNITNKDINQPIFISIYNITESNTNKDFDYLDYDKKGYEQFQIELKFICFRDNDELIYQFISNNTIKQYYTINDNVLNMYTIRFSDLSYFIDLNYVFSFPIRIQL